jgi:16S rRNA (cytidine1402-2'-O)-methyltransferase
MNGARAWPERCTWSHARSATSADLGARALQVLGSVAASCAEDTRHTRQLLAAHGLEAAADRAARAQRGELAWKLVERLRGGDSLALVSDAGTPLVSDPGYRLVREARAAGMPVSPVPGACAAIAALSVAGIPSDRFCFEGFLPAKARARRERCRRSRANRARWSFTNPSHRIEESLADMSAIFGPEARGGASRANSTKLFETVLGDTLAAIASACAPDEQPAQGRVRAGAALAAHDDGSAALLGKASACTRS